MTSLWACVLALLLVLAIRAALGPFSERWAALLIAWLFLTYGTLLLTLGCLIAAAIQ